MGYKFTIGGSENGRFCSGLGFSAGLFCVESSPLSGILEKLPNGAEKIPIDGIYGALD